MAISTIITSFSSQEFKCKAKHKWFIRITPSLSLSKKAWTRLVWMPWNLWLTTSQICTKFKVKRTLSKILVHLQKRISTKLAIESAIFNKNWKITIIIHLLNLFWKAPMLIDLETTAKKAKASQARSAIPALKNWIKFTKVTLIKETVTL
jgi:hypothetical protein